jgi:hypothetical protein
MCNPAPYVVNPICEYHITCKLPHDPSFSISQGFWSRSRNTGPLIEAIDPMQHPAHTTMSISWFCQQTFSDASGTSKGSLRSCKPRMALEHLKSGGLELLPYSILKSLQFISTHCTTREVHCSPIDFQIHQNHSFQSLAHNPKIMQLQKPTRLSSKPSFEV